MLDPPSRHDTYKVASFDQTEAESETDQTTFRIDSGITNAATFAVRLVVESNIFFLEVISYTIAPQTI